MVQKLKQYRNLIMVAAAAVFFIALLASDPLGFFTRRAQAKAAIRNQMAIERAETEKEIALIQARTEAELVEIRRNSEIAGAETAGIDTQTAGTGAQPVGFEAAGTGARPTGIEADGTEAQPVGFEAPGTTVSAVETSITSALPHSEEAGRSADTPPGPPDVAAEATEPSA